MKALAVGGMEDHALSCCLFRPPWAIAKAMRAIKSGSSWWMHETCELRSFDWQEGYGPSPLASARWVPQLRISPVKENTIGTRDFQAEFIAILKKHRIEYDPRYVWLRFDRPYGPCPV